MVGKVGKETSISYGVICSCVGSCVVHGTLIEG